MNDSGSTQADPALLEETRLPAPENLALPDRPLSRRGLLGAGLAAALIGKCSPAGAQTSGTNPLTGPTTSWKRPELRLARRITMGLNAQEAVLAQNLGYSAYLERQLNDAAIDDSAVESAIAQNYPMLSLPPVQLATVYVKPLLILSALYRGIYSQRQLRERMVEFWSNHFHTNVNKVSWLKVLDDLSLQSGWLGRHLATAPPLQATAPMRALSLGYNIPITLSGANKTLALPDPSQASLAGNPRYHQANQNWLRNAYANAAEVLQEAATASLDTLSLLQKINFADYTPAGGAVYPTSTLGHSLKATAALIKAQVGVEAIHTDYGVWDTHTQAGPANGYLAGLMRDFADSLAAFHADVFAQNTPNVSLVALSEFGRTVRENASQGTDHGHGNAMFVLGDHITGGRVLTQFHVGCPGCPKFT